MKRKTTITLMILMLIIALCGCSSKSANTIQLWDPAEEQAQVALEILTSGGHSAFAAYEVDKSYQTLKMGIEYYQDGKLVKDAKEGTIALRENEDNAKETHGIAGFLFQNGKATIGASAGASCSSCSDIDLPGFKAEDEESLASIGMPSAKNIADSEKIYLGALNAGSDTINTEILDNTDSKEYPKGKTWLFYAIFSTEP
ncbi:MAG: hypothetical protein MSA09_00405 [Lachnospiraceae bacterium]|nr:hypothetical protein [Lachnospiraceae bacterium]